MVSAPYHRCLDMPRLMNDTRYAEVSSTGGYGCIPEAAGPECTERSYDTTGLRPQLEKKLIEEELIEPDSVNCYILLRRHPHPACIFVWRESWSLRSQAAAESSATTKTNYTHTLTTCDKLGST